MKQIPADIRLSVQIESKRESEPDLYLVSRLEEQEDDEHILISAPMNGDLLYPIQKNEKIILHFTDEKALFGFQGIALVRVKKGDLPFLRVRVISDVVRTQRRADFRLQISIGSEFLIEQVDEAGKPSEATPQCVISDISGGGVGILTSHKLNMGDKLVMMIPMEKNAPPMKLKAEVRRVMKQQPEEGGRYLAGLRFLYSNKTQKEHVVKYVFHMQQKRGRR